MFNPASNGGRGEKRIPRYLELLRRHLPQFDHAVSARSGDEASLTEEALRTGYHTIVAAGGDGTWSAVADRILSLNRGDVTFGVLPGGTGNDFCRNLGIPGNDLEGAVRNLVEGKVISVDAGRIVGPSRHEDRGDATREGRFFLNVVGFGFDVAVVDGAKGASFLRGELLYKATAVQQLFRFPGFQVTLEDDEGFRRSDPTLMLTVTNGEHFGGGFPIAPGASVQDGLLHACYIGDAKPLRRLVLFDKAGKGRHEGSREVDSRAATRFRLSFPRPFRFEVDGDVYAASECGLTLEVMKGALRVLAP
ncbi:MAG: diacylglycerol kinase family protein [Gemmatimonadota bacterium]